MDKDRVRQLMGDKISKLRKDAGYRSQQALGEEVGLHQTMISQIETGRRSIPEDRLEKFAEKLGVPPRELKPESLGQKYVSGSVKSKEDLGDWRDMVIQDESLPWGTKSVLLSITTPPFLSREDWIVTVTIDQLVRETGRSRELVETHWNDMLNSDYVERIGEVEWVLRLVFPEG